MVVRSTCICLMSVSIRFWISASIILLRVINSVIIFVEISEWNCFKTGLTCSKVMFLNSFNSFLSDFNLLIVAWISWISCNIGLITSWGTSSFELSNENNRLFNDCKFFLIATEFWKPDILSLRDAILDSRVVNLSIFWRKRFCFFWRKLDMPFWANSISSLTIPFKVSSIKTFRFFLSLAISCRPSW